MVNFIIEISIYRHTFGRVEYDTSITNKNMFTAKKNPERTHSKDDVLLSDPLIPNHTTQQNSTYFKSKKSYHVLKIHLNKKVSLSIRFSPRYYPST